MKNSLFKKLEKCAPPGTESGRIRNQLLLPPAIAASWSITCFMTRLLSAVSDLYVYTGNYRKVFRWDAEMPEFQDLVTTGYWFFWAALLFAAGLAVSNYRSFTRETKSIYVMKRLPDGGELRRRVITVPLLLIGVSGLCCAVLMALHYGTYLLITPDPFVQKLTGAEFLESFGRALLW